MLLKICNKCGRHLQADTKCSCYKTRHKLYNNTLRDKAKNTFYYSAKWTALVKLIKARANGLDEYALALDKIELGTTVHHIYTIDERPDLKMSPDNLIYVSAKTHNQIHAEYRKSSEKKKELQTKLLNIIKQK